MKISSSIYQDTKIFSNINEIQLYKSIIFYSEISGAFYNHKIMFPSINIILSISKS